MPAPTKLGRYELRQILGKGAMGVVYEGFDPRLSRRVAIKTILKSVGLDEQTEREYAARFSIEAKAVARLNHPNIVQVYDFGEEGDVAYLVMEYVEGRELRSSLIAKEIFSISDTIRIMGELLDALDFAHDAGVIHRDIKPANVMLDTKRRAKLADFGVARLQDPLERSQIGTMVGTPAFMSPEQIRCEKIDRRTDIFSAGVVLYQLLTGEHPFKGTSNYILAKNIIEFDPLAPSSIASTVSPALDKVVYKALAKVPANRYVTARDFASDLRNSFAPQSLRPAELVSGSTLHSSAHWPTAEKEFWGEIQNSTDPADFKPYLAEFPESAFSAIAQHKLERLNSLAMKSPEFVKKKGPHRANRFSPRAQIRQGQAQHPEHESEKSFAFDPDATRAIGQKIAPIFESPPVKTKPFSPASRIGTGAAAIKAARGQVSVPYYVEKDGTKTLFLPNCRMKKGYEIGERNKKDKERGIQSYWEALEKLMTMNNPRFRRKNMNGIFGTVKCQAGDLEWISKEHIQLECKKYGG